MAESLRDLVVTLSLKNENFTRNIKSVDKQIKELNAQFKEASAYVTDYERSTEGLTAKVTTLQQAIGKQQQIVDQYTKALESSRATLEKDKKASEAYAQKLAAAKQNQEALAKEIRDVTLARQDALVAEGEQGATVTSLDKKLTDLNKRYAESEKEISKLENKCKTYRNAVQNDADAVTQANINLSEAKATLAGMSRELDNASTDLKMARDGLFDYEDAAESAEKRIERLSSTISVLDNNFKAATAGIKDVTKSKDGLTKKTDYLAKKQKLENEVVEQWRVVLKSAEEELKIAQKTNDPKRIDEATRAVERAKIGLSGAEKSLASTNEQLKETDRHLRALPWDEASKKLDNFSKKAASLSSAMATAGRTLTRYATTPLVTLGTAAVKASLDFESSFTSVRKTVDASEEEFAQLAAASKKMSTQIAASTSEINEIHSMTMEHFAYPYMESFFENADKYRYYHLTDALRSIPYLVSVDEFQHRVFENPKMSAADRRAAWHEIEQIYLPWRDYDGNEFLAGGGFWMQKQHIFLYPFYYIDYALAQICAFQFLAKDRADHASAWADYLKLCKSGGSLGYFDTLKFAGLDNPFEPGTIEKVMACVKATIAEFEAKL